MRLLILLTFSLLIGCSSKPTDTNFKISIGNLISASEKTGGGLGIWARDVNTGERYGSVYPGGTTSVDIAYKPGTYEFFFVTWDGDANLNSTIGAGEPQNLTGNTYCEHIPGLVVGGANMTVDVSLDNVKCDNMALSKGPGSFSNTTLPYSMNPAAKAVFNNSGIFQFSKIGTFELCEDFYSGPSTTSLFTLGSDCIHLAGDKVNVKVSLMSFDPLSGARVDVISRCYLDEDTNFDGTPDTAYDGRVDLSQITLPWGSENFPAFTKVELFINETTDDCDDSNESQQNDGPPTYMSFDFPDGIGHGSVESNDLIFSGNPGDQTRMAYIAFNEIGAGLSLFRELLPYTKCSGNDCVEDTGNTYIVAPENNTSEWIRIPADAFAGIKGAGNYNNVAKCHVPAGSFNAVTMQNLNAEKECVFQLSNGGGSSTEVNANSFTINVEFYESDGATQVGTAQIINVYMSAVGSPYFYQAQNLKKTIWDFTGTSTGRSPHDEYCFGGSQCWYPNNKNDTIIGEIKENLDADGIGGFLFSRLKNLGIQTCTDLESHIMSNGPMVVSDIIIDEGVPELIDIEVSQGQLMLAPFMTSQTGSSFDLRLKLLKNGTPDQILEIDCDPSTSSTNIYQRSLWTHYSTTRDEMGDSVLWLKAQDYTQSGGFDIEYAEEFTDIEYTNAGSTVNMYRFGREITKLVYNGVEYFGKSTSTYTESRFDGSAYDTRMGITKVGFVGKPGTGGEFAFYGSNDHIDGLQDNSSYLDSGDFCLDGSCTGMFSLGGDETNGRYAAATDKRVDTEGGADLNVRFHSKFLYQSSMQTITQSLYGTGGVEEMSAAALGASDQDFSFDCIVDDSCSTTNGFSDFLGPQP